MPVRVKGVSQTRTMAAVRGCGVHSNERHVHHFQMASLELERSRRTRERQAAVERIKTIDARLLEIDALIRKRLAALGMSGDDGRAAGGPAPEASAAPSQRRRTLRY